MDIGIVNIVIGKKRRSPHGMYCTECRSEVAAVTITVRLQELQYGLLINDIDKDKGKLFCTRAIISGTISILWIY